ncbi:WXG100 family type VII secretion target [Nocardia sp. NPDC050710]|uniref:WXG100 family type VII secretion target n=1 Tax=Nocardia sp. NPDC050710 TaxID=3157220 RepID=UPI00340CF455
MGDSGAGEVALSVVPAELVTAARAIKNLLNNLSGGFRSLDQDVGNLTDNWVGYQGTVFATGWSEVREGLSDLLNALEEITTALDASAEQYLGRDHANAEAVESARSSLDL